MKQILQDLRNGSTKVLEVPVPRNSRGRLQVKTQCSLISAGTERMLVEFGKAGWVEKARQQPDKVRMVLEKVSTDGFAATLDAVQSKLDQPLPLGYCNVGVVSEVGVATEGFSPGDRIASNGHHAEFVSVPPNLCAKIPDCVSDEAATFTVMGAIGLQGIRLVNPSLGECVVVTGLGLIGLMTVQMLRAQGCRVLGIDYDAARLKLAKQFGAEVVNPGAGEDVLGAAQSFSRGRGVDAVIITASTKSNEPVSQAAQMCRKRGRIVLVGVTGLQLSRADFFEKELTFQVSCSYGPGRYDPQYEERGQDYPVGFVRWTEQRNFEAVLDLIASGQLDVMPLISHRFDLAQAADAYSLLASGAPSLGIVINYPNASNSSAATDRDLRPQDVRLSDLPAVAAKGNVAFLGAGNYAGRVLIPAFKAAGAQLQTVVSAGGVSAVHYGKKFGFASASTNSATPIEDPGVDTLVVATRHDAHARQVLAGLKAGKHVFCEKPLCLTISELEEIEAAKSRHPDQLLMVGFNRRFAPLVVKLKSLVDTVIEPKAVVVTVNAGDIPPDHWTQDRVIGGGRIIGEACHFVDLIRHIIGSPVTRWQVVSMGRQAGISITEDKSSINFEFEDGSIGTVHYLANGHKSFPKERIEVFCGGKILQLDNFRKLRGWGWKGFTKATLLRQDKGQRACAQAFIDAIRNGATSPIPVAEIMEVSRATIEVAEQTSR